MVKEGLSDRKRVLADKSTNECINQRLVKLLNDKQGNNHY